MGLTNNEPYIEKEHPIVQGIPLDKTILDQCKKEGCSAWMNAFMDDKNKSYLMYYVLANISGKIIYSTPVQETDDGWMINEGRVRFDLMGDSLVYRFLEYLKEPPIMSLPEHRLIQTDMHGTIINRIKLE